MVVEAFSPLVGLKSHDVHNSTGHDISAILGTDFNLLLKYAFAILVILVHHQERTLISFKCTGAKVNSLY